MFGKISILGCGLIGSSILRAIEEKRLATKISVHDKSNKVTEYLKKNFTVDICSNVNETTNDADLVIISSPLSSYKEILLSIKSTLKEGSILTDTGSAKKEVNKIVNNLGFKNISWIASHPIAGTEYSGPAAGFSSLFRDRWCILSADNQVAKDKIENLEKFWSKLGSKVKTNSSQVFRLLAKSGILVRKMDVYGIKNSLRITIGTTSENIALIKKLRKILNVR